MNIEIKKINTEKAYQVRHYVMWPKKSIDSIKLEKDTESFHFVF